MGPLDAIKTCLAKSFQFKGRASRSEFWWFVSFLLLLGAAALYADAQIWGWEFKNGHNATILSSALLIVMLVPATSAAFRRVQDIGFHVVYLLLPALATILETEVHSIMFDWFRMHEEPLGHSEGAWLRHLADLSEIITVATYGLLALILAAPSNFAQRFQTNNPAEVPQ